MPQSNSRSFALVELINRTKKICPNGNYVGFRPTRNVRADNDKTFKQMLDVCLITKDGRPRLTAMRTLERETGVKIMKGEGDSFGCLSAVVVFPDKSSIVFG